MKKLLLLTFLITSLWLNTHAQENTISTFTVSDVKATRAIKFNNRQLSIGGAVLSAAAEDKGNYTLTVTLKGKTVLTKQHIKGVSKVLYQNGYLLFSVFSYLTPKGGENEGYGYVINTKDASVKSYPKRLHKTCNPVILNGEVYFVDGLSMVKTDLELHQKDNISIVYITKEKNMHFLATYMVFDLAQTSGNNLLVNFAPKNDVSLAKVFAGTIGKATTIIMLK
jgi:hypothetical protein